VPQEEPSATSATFDSLFTREEGAAIAMAAAQAGAREVICIAWVFDMALRLEFNARMVAESA
jgi:hypothetical protein